MAAAKGMRRDTLAIALGIIVTVTLVYLMAPDFFKIVEFTLYDQHFRLRGPRGAHPQVAVVAIDEASLRSVGRWPWSRSVQADLVSKLDAAGAAVIAFDVILSEAEKSGEQEAAARIAQRLRARGASAQAVREAERAAEGTYDLRVTPVSPIFPGVEKHANVAANIIDGRFIDSPFRRSLDASWGDG